MNKWLKTAGTMTVNAGLAVCVAGSVFETASIVSETFNKATLEPFIPADATNVVWDNRDPIVRRFSYEARGMECSTARPAQHFCIPKTP